MSAGRRGDASPKEEVMANGPLMSRSTQARGPRAIFISAVQFDERLKAGSTTVLDLAPLAASFGVEGVEYRDVHWRDKAAEIPAAKRQLVQLKLRAVYATVTPLYHRDPALQKQLLQDIEDARALGAILLRVVLGERPGDGPADAGAHYSGRKAVERAAALRVPLSLENNSKAPGHLLPDIQKTVETFSCRWLGTNIDSANYVVTGQDPVGATQRLARWVNYAHLKDARKIGDAWQSTHLGNGTLPLREIVAALEATGKAVPFCFEFPGEGDPEGAVRKSLEFLAKLGG
jgi:sugar phosphate isomerase/epimerase